LYKKFTIPTTTKKRRHIYLVTNYQLQQHHTQGKKIRKLDDKNPLQPYLIFFPYMTWLTCMVVDNEKMRVTMTMTVTGIEMVVDIGG
jgi:hypothetical protein